MVRAVVAGVLAVVWLGPQVAGAANSKDAAKEYNQKAKDAFDAGDFETAADQFTRALELFPEPRIRLNLGVAMENLGRLDDARDNYEAFLRAVPKGPKADVVKDKMRALDKLMKERGKVIITVEPTPDEVVVGGTTFRRLRPVKVWLAPGTHAVVARREGYAPAERQVTVEAGAASEVSVQLTAQGRTEAAAPSTAPAPAAPSPAAAPASPAAAAPSTTAAPTRETTATPADPQPTAAPAPAGETTAAEPPAATEKKSGGFPVMRAVLGGAAAAGAGVAALVLVGTLAAVGTAGGIFGAWNQVVGLDRYRMPLNVGLWVSLGLALVGALLVPLALLTAVGLGAGAVFAG